MLKSFEITNFRGIKELKLDNLKQINVLTGKNSSGKTSILESLFIHGGHDNLTLPLTVNAMRGVQWFASDMEQSFGPFFHDGHITDKIQFMGWDQNNYWSKVELSLEQLPGMSQQSSVRSSTTSAGVGKLQITFSDSRKRRSAVSAMPQPDGAFNVERGKHTPQTTTGVYVSAATSGFPEDVIRFTKLDTENKTDSVIRSLQIVDPSLRGVSIALLSGQAVLYADLGLNRKIPLQFAGEGLKRMAAITLAIATCPNGFVLVDEIENGFHYSVLPKFWMYLTEITKLFNVQVFATTHSWECLQAAGSILGKSDTTCSLLRLDRNEGGLISVQEYDEATFKAAIDSGIEVR